MDKENSDNLSDNNKEDETEKQPEVTNNTEKSEDLIKEEDSILEENDVNPDQSNPEIILEKKKLVIDKKWMIFGAVILVVIAIYAAMSLGTKKKNPITIVYYCNNDYTVCKDFNTNVLDVLTKDATYGEYVEVIYKNFNYINDREESLLFYYWSNDPNKPDLGTLPIFVINDTYVGIGNPKDANLLIEDIKTMISSTKDTTIKSIILNDFDKSVMTLDELYSTIITDDLKTDIYYYYKQSDLPISSITTKLNDVDFDVVIKVNDIKYEDWYQVITDTNTIMPTLINKSYPLLGFFEKITIEYCANGNLTYAIALDSKNFSDLSVEALLKNYLILDADGQATTLPNDYNEEKTLREAAAKAEEEARAAEAAAEAERKKSYAAGTYKIGVDLPAGEYVILANASSAGYYAIRSDSSGSLQSIISNDNFDYNAIVIVSDGQYLEVTRGRIYRIDGVELDTSGSGTFKVGYHIPAGEYKIVQTSTVSAYIEVSTNPSGSIYSIVTNDNFEGVKYITVNDGQYLTITRGKIE